ncbi:MAG: ATP-dependent DNA helicase RecG [Myxococcota bacterium]
MKNLYNERLGILLNLAESQVDISTIREEIKRLKIEFPEKKGFFEDLYQTTINCNELSLRLFKILLESEVIKTDGKRENIQSAGNTFYAEETLNKPIQYIKGVGPVLFERFRRKGINTIRDALFFFPRDYEDRRAIIPINRIVPGENVTVVGKVIRSGKTRKTFTMTISDTSGFLDLVWFHIQPHYEEHLINKYKPNTTVIVSGKARMFKRNIQINHPIIKETGNIEDDLFFKRIIPVYSAIEGISEGHLIKIMKTIVDEFSNYIIDPLPDYLIQRYNLIPLNLAIREIHFPSNNTDFEEIQSNRWRPRRRLIFDELFALEMLLVMRKERYKRQMGFTHNIKESTVADAIKKLPFELTRSQNQSLQEIIRDMKSDKQMNRLLIGDVGSGKTAVAMITSYLAALSGSQTAILVPTEILARQHYNNFCKLLPDIKSRIGLLTGSIKGAERSRIVGDISLGHIKIIIGTHALLEENIQFKNLTYVIIDEQHQFGINQRAKMKSKGINADLLMMSATPIPRTLAISLYGDLDISLIKELPPGRKEVITKVIRGDKAERFYIDLKRQITQENQQCYIVYPLISESDKLDLKAAEDMYQHLKETQFREIPIGLIHGRISDDEKIRIMNEFKEGKLQILIATTVIEVGVDVPNASIMVIEHAERFGLSQLHQLRGRVGRGTKTSFCYLIAYNWLTENAYERLKIMEKTNNGFKIAEEDLRIRGPGELAGTRQSGLPDLHMSNLIRDADILEETREAAIKILKEDPELLQPGHLNLRELLKKRECDVELITTS